MYPYTLAAIRLLTAKIKANPLLLIVLHYQPFVIVISRLIAPYYEKSATGGTKRSIKTADNIVQNDNRPHLSV